MADRINDGGPAFPEAIAVGPAGDVYPGMGGMSLRDYFAAKALMGWLASYGATAQHPATIEGKAGAIAENSYELADAMLKAREAQP